MSALQGALQPGTIAACRKPKPNAWLREGAGRYLRAAIGAIDFMIITLDWR